MPFIPHTDNDIQAMLETIGVNQIETLFDEIPTEIRCKPLSQLPEGINELALNRLMQSRAQQDEVKLQFIGAGAYEHHIPAAVWDITTRGEFMTAYTPYQAEASQGTLQLLYEYQTMMASLTGMEVSNASLYDGASALAEAILMAVRLQKSSTARNILLPSTVHPYYRATVKTCVEAQHISLTELPFDQHGHIDSTRLTTMAPENIAALVIPFPNFFGLLEEVDALTDWAHQHNILVIAVVNPLALALLKEPGQWGQRGADIVCGEGQPFGMPLASGGPYAGFLCCKQSYVRQMPGRIIGATVDKDGKRGFTLTLQAREQHIRRSKATSNICTNQGLLVTAATIYMSLLGFTGLQRTAQQCHFNTKLLLEKLINIPGISVVFHSPYFHEIVIKIPQLVEVMEKLAQQHILAGYALEPHYPTLKDCLLICVTETKTAEDITLFADTIAAIIQA